MDLNSGETQQMAEEELHEGAQGLEEWWQVQHMAKPKQQTNTLDTMSLAP